MLITQTLLQEFLTETKADSAIIFDATGVVILAENIDFEDSVSAMSNAIISMCNKFLSDLEKQELKQLIVKTADSTIVFTKINTEKTVAVFINAASNFGIFLHQVDALAKKLN